VLDIYDFGKKLLNTKDLDPVYVLLHEASLCRDELRRWLVAYWCFYHVGTASWITSVSSEEQYWRRMQAAAHSKDYPRSSERRHFRGDNAKKSVTFLQNEGLDLLFNEFDKAYYENRRLSCEEVIDYVQEWVGFGPWIAFKVADMLERLGLCEIEFDTQSITLFESPQKGAELLWQVEHGRTNFPSENVAGWAVARILQELQKEKHIKAPPSYNRNLNIQEAETILCKWKSYMNSSYTIGEDIQHCREGLIRFARCRLSQVLLKAGKVGKLW
jgi:hypothetical protein